MAPVSIKLSALFTWMWSKLKSESNPIEYLSRGLQVDQDRIQAALAKHGLDEAGRILGFDVMCYDNLLLAGRIAMYNLYAVAPTTLLEYAEIYREHLNLDTYAYIQQHHRELQLAIDKWEHLDFEDHDWFSANTMFKIYAAKLDDRGKTLEPPKYLWMREAIQLYHRKSIEDVLQTYEDYIVGWYTPATPTLLNGGKVDPQMSSCFVLTLGDSLESIYDVLKIAALISKNGGGLGLDVSNIRHSEINKVGPSGGIIPMLKPYDDTMAYVDQKGVRKGNCTVFLRTHHIDALDFVKLTLKVGDHQERTPNLNTCLWTSWLFWKRLQNNQDWTFFCPAKTKSLNNLYGLEFEKEYIRLEQDKSIDPRHKKTIPAREFHELCLQVACNSGGPYIMQGDSCNLKSNQRNLGYIRSSNLCLEIVEYTDEETVAVCNLHSLSLRMFGVSALPRDVVNLPSLPTDLSGIYSAIRNCINFSKLAEVTRRAIRNLNQIIDENWYPLDKVDANGKVIPGLINGSNKKHRPVGLGASGLAELLYILDIPYEHPVVEVIHRMVFACIHYNSLAESIDLAIIDGPYSSFQGSPASQGKFQFDLWREEFEILGPNAARKAEDDIPVDPLAWGQEVVVLNNGDTIQPRWDDERRCMMSYGLRNSLHNSYQPTATTAQIRRNCESVEPHQSNLYSRQVLNGNYPVFNRYLEADLRKVQAWNKHSYEYVKIKNGSVQGLTEYIKSNPNKFPDTQDWSRLEFLELKYKTIWEIKQKWRMRLAAVIGRYNCQSQSFNLYIAHPTTDQLRAAHMWGYMLGLKTIMYYLRQKGGETIKFTANPELLQSIGSSGVIRRNSDEKKLSVCNSVDENGVCSMCT